MFSIITLRHMIKWSSNNDLLTYALNMLYLLLYSDMAESERSLTIDRFRQATLDWNRKVNAPEELVEAKVEGQRSSVLVVTDACLPLIAAGESPFSARVLVNYELPTKKETYWRRISTCLPSDGVVINMVVGGEVVILKSIEEGCGIIIEEMPIHVGTLVISEIL
ncbi:ATP-dependent RNA helicase [Nymphaea thermarum]|nr:ATP-dependent RNA helicase [Nymphaea thermarum]